MNLGKGFLFSAVGALVGAVLWILIIRLSGWSLWILAPVVGGAAGYGMMRGTQMKGGVPAGVLAAAVALIAIFGARYFVVSQFVQSKLAITGEDAYGFLTDEIAADMQGRGLEIYDEEGEYTPRVQRKAYDAWTGMTEYEKEQYIAAHQQESNAAAEVLTPLGLLFDFGIFGTICAVLSAGTAFKTASTKLEEALVEKGLAAGTADAASLAAHMRAGGSVDNAPARVVNADGAKAGSAKPGSAKPGSDTPSLQGSSGGIWAIPMRAAEERPIKRVKIVSSDEPPTDQAPPPPSQEAA